MNHGFCWICTWEMPVLFRVSTRKCSNQSTYNWVATVRPALQRKNVTALEFFLTESQGQNLVLTVLHVPYLLDSGKCSGLLSRGPEERHTCFWNWALTVLYVLFPLDSVKPSIRHTHARSSTRTSIAAVLSTTECFVGQMHHHGAWQRPPFLVY